jgi:beta-lactamase superfamily II metal-dependent hydrolase
MTDHFVLHVLPAGIGDALVLDYGTDDATSRILIDGGVTKTAPGLAEFLGPAPALELLVVTHVDNDHIQGALSMLEKRLVDPIVGDVWFNGFRHLPESPLESMGPAEGERLTTLIVERDLPWNAHEAFGGHAVAVADPACPPVAVLPGGLSCTVLSPGPAQLQALRPKWLPAVQEANLDPAALLPEEELPPPGRLERMGAPDLDALAAQKTPVDATEANGSSIALLVSWAGRTALLAGDAHPDVLLATLDAWLGKDAPLDVDLFKLPHHGSKANVTNALIKRVRAKCYVFSSSGEGRSQHPNDQAVARAIVHSTGRRTLAFNYRNPRTEVWDDQTLKDERGYSTMYPDAAEHGGLTIDLLTL